MNGFEYKYNTPNDIFQNILLLQELSPIDIGVFCVILLFFIINILYIMPSINILVSEYTKQKKSQKRKNFIKQIAIQKDIEDQIMQEIDAH